MHFVIQLVPYSFLFLITKIVKYIDSRLQDAFDDFYWSLFSMGTVPYLVFASF